MVPCAVSKPDVGATALYMRIISLVYKIPKPSWVRLTRFHVFNFVAYVHVYGTLAGFIMCPPSDIAAGLST